MTGTTAVGAGVTVPLGQQDATLIAAAEFDPITAPLQAPAPRLGAAARYRARGQEGSVPISIIRIRRSQGPATAVRRLTVRVKPHQPQ